MNRKSITVFLALLSMLCTTAVAYDVQFADKTKTQKLRWKGNVIPISISRSMLNYSPSIRPNTDVSGALSRSLEAWARVANVRFVELPSERNSISSAGRHGDGVSLITVAQTAENLLLFAGDSSDVSARTRVFFNSKGYITEADIVLNPYQQFSSDGSFGTFDLEATLTHEIGHLLGLEHSFIVGATMHANQGMNGVYGLKSFVSRTLAEDDIAGVRSIYGTSEQSKDCCGKIIGKLSGLASKIISGTQVWIENRENGQVIAGVLADENGDFLAEGLSVGEYSVVAKSSSFELSDDNFATSDLGTVEVFRGKSVSIARELYSSNLDFGLHYVGFGGQLSSLAVPVNAGNSYVIYIGGKNLDADRISIGFNSPYIHVTPKSIINHRFSGETSAVSFEVNLSQNIPFGEYSIFVTNSQNETDVLIGSLSVSDFENTFNSFSIANNN